MDSPLQPYKLDVVPLTEGLNFNTATSLAQPGTLRDCLNYEFVDGAGLKRINGFRQYDGNDRSHHDKVYFLKVVTTVVYPSDALYAKSPWLYVENTDNPDNIPFGYMLWGSITLPYHGGPGAYTTLVPFVKLDCPSFADPSIKIGDIKTLNSAVFTAAETLGTNQYIVTAQELTTLDRTAILGAAGTYYADAEHALLKNPGNHQGVNYVNVTNGYFDALEGVWAERLNGVTYQISDAIVVEGACGNQAYPGDYLYLDAASTRPLLCLKAELLTGTWASGTARLHLASLSGYVEASTTSTPTKLFDLSNGAGDFTQAAEGALTLYRDSGPPVMAGAQIPYSPNQGNISDRATIACMYTMHGEIAALQADSVWSVESVDAAQGASYSISTHNYTAGTGSSEVMPIIAGGAVKAVIPTKQGDSYASNVSFTHVTGGLAKTPITGRVSPIDRVFPRFHHTGWVIPFREGDRKYGYLNKIDRYKSIDGNDYSSSSSIAGLEASRVIEGANPTNAPIFTPSHGMGGTTTRWKNSGYWKTNAEADVTDVNVATALGDEDDTAYIYQQMTNSVAYVNSPYTSTLILGGFSGTTPLSDIPEGSSIKGIKVTARIDDKGSTVNIPDDIELAGYVVLGKAEPNEFNNWIPRVNKQFGMATELMSGTSSLRTAFDNAAVTDGTFTAGGADNLFGAAVITLDDVLDPGFCIGIYLKTNLSGTALPSTLDIRFDHVYVEVFYEKPSVRYYFKSNSTSHAGNDAITIHGDLVDYTVTSGSFESGDAEGYLTVVNLRTITANSSVPAGLTLSDSSVPYYTVLPNMDIYQDAGLTVKVGEVSGEMTFNGFDSYRTVKQAGTRYTTVRANFFANDEYEAFYLCSGAGRAGIWDSKYWSRIYAINPKQANADTLDRPRHVAVHKFCLMLGYQSGSVLHSAPGEPSNFSAFDGGGEIGIGDKIHGFSRLQGNALGVFCEESVHAIVGETGSFGQEVLVPNEGAIEYTVASFGNRVIYTSKTGITTLDQSEKYGNFTGRPLSHDVNPWLIPRITGNPGLSFNLESFTPRFQAGSEIVCAYSFPRSNQYRLWFRDGRQLWLTLVADDMPRCTFVQYFTGAKTSYADYDLHPLPMVPMYVAVTGSTSLNPKILALFDREFCYTAQDSGLDLNYLSVQGGLYLLDVGDGFDSASCASVGIPCYALVNYQYLKNPFTSKTLRKVRLEGQSRGAAPLTVYTGNGYKSLTADFKTTGTNISLPITLSREMSVETLPESTLANVAATGRILGILLVGMALDKDIYYETVGEVDPATSETTLLSTRTTVATPSHYLQALLLQFEEGQEDA